MNVLSLTPQQVGEAWGVVEEHARALAARFPDDWPVAELIRRVVAGETVLWLVWSEDDRSAYGILGTEVRVKASGKRVLCVVCAAGRDHERWVAVAEAKLTDHARLNECAEFHVDGRAGWARSLPGWQAQRWVNLVKVVT